MGLATHAPKPHTRSSRQPNQNSREASGRAVLYLLRRESHQGWPHLKHRSKSSQKPADSNQHQPTMHSPHTFPFRRLIMLFQHQEKKGRLRGCCRELLVPFFLGSSDSVILCNSLSAFSEMNRYNQKD